MRKTVIRLLCGLALFVPASHQADVTGMEFVPLQPFDIQLTECDAASVSGNYIAVAAEEGARHQNGKHAYTNATLQYYDIAKNRVTNTRVAVASDPAIEGDLIAVKLQATGTLGIYAINATALFKRGINETGLPMDYGWDGRKRISGGKLLLNSNGSPYLYDLNTGVVRAIPVGLDATISGNIVAFTGSNATIQYYDIGADVVTDTRIGGNGPITDGSGIMFQFIDPSTYRYTLGYYDLQTKQFAALGFMDVFKWGFQGGKLVMLVREGAFWGDLNGDQVIGPVAWEEEIYVVVYDVKTGRLVNTQVRACCGGDIDNGIIAFDVYEGDVGQDLNGDGDMDDCVQHYMSIQGLFQP